MSFNAYSDYYFSPVFFLALLATLLAALKTILILVKRLPASPLPFLSDSTTYLIHCLHWHNLPFTLALTRKVWLSPIHLPLSYVQPLLLTSVFSHLRWGEGDRAYTMHGSRNQYAHADVDTVPWLPAPPTGKEEITAGARVTSHLEALGTFLSFLFLFFSTNLN
jgi:hypothetical protein